MSTIAVNGTTPSPNNHGLEKREDQLRALLSGHKFRPIQIQLETLHSDQDFDEPNPGRYQELLSSGILPIEIFEDFKVINLNSPIHGTVTSVFQPLLATLGFKGNDPSSFQFLLYDSNIPGIHPVQHSNPPTILVSRGTFVGRNALRDVDGLLYLMARAVHNYKLFSDHGNRASNLQTQGVADFRAVESVQRAGFSPEAALAVLPHLTHHHDAALSNDNFIALFPKSPAARDQALIIAAGLSRLVRTVGSVNTDTCSIDCMEDLIREMAHAEYQSPIQRQLELMGFEGSSVAARWKILTDVVKETTNWRESIQKEIEVAIQAVRSSFSGPPREDDTDISFGKPTNKRKKDSHKESDPSSKLITPKVEEAARGFINAVLAMDPERHSRTMMSLYRNAVEACGWKNSPQGYLAEINSLLVSFIEAESKDAILERALKLRERFHSIPGLSRLIDASEDSITWNQFGGLVRGQQVPWESHFQAASHFTGDQQEAIFEILYGLEIFDPRIAEMNLEFAWDFFHGNRRVLGFPQGDHSYPPYTVDAEGNVARILHDQGRKGSPSVIDFGDEHGRMLGHYISALCDRVGNSTTRKSALERLSTLDTRDGHALIRDVLGGSPQAILESSLLSADTTLFINLTSEIIAFRPVQKILTSTLAKLARTKEGQAVVVTFFEQFSIRPDLTAKLFPSQPGTGLEGNASFHDSPLLEYAIEKGQPFLTPTLRWNLLTRSGVFEYAYLHHPDPWKLELFLEQTLRPIVNDYLVDDGQGERYQQEMCSSWQDLSDRLSNTALRKLDHIDYLANLEAQVLLNDTCPSITDIVHLQDIVSLYGRQHTSLRREIVKKLDRAPQFGDEILHAVRCWKTLHTLELFPSIEIAYATLRPLVQKIADIDSPEVKVGLVEHILLAPPDTSVTNAEIYDLAMVEQLIDIWGEAIGATFPHQHRTEDGADPLFQLGSEIAQRIAEHSPPVYLKLWLHKYSKIIQSQELLTQEIARCIDLAGDDLIDVSATFQSMSDGIIQFLDASKFARRVTMEMLVAPASTDPERYFAQALLERYKIEREDLRWLILPEAAKLEDWAKLARVVFRRETIEQQTLMVMRLLAPPFIPDPDSNPGEAASPEEAAERHAIGLLLEHSLPISNASGRLLGEYIRQYFSGLNRYERFMTATMLLHAEQARSSRGLSVGYSFAIACREHGPLETWIAQTAHASPQVPKVIRQGIEAVNIKTNVNEPYRWDAFPWIREALPPDEFRDFRHYGDTLGSGKVWVTFSAESKSHGEEALQLRRKDAPSLIEAGYERWKRGVEAMKRARLATGVLDNLIYSAVRSCRTESHVELSPQQFALANELINGRKVIIRANSIDAEYQYRTPELISFGENKDGLAYRRMTRLPGPHFLDLAESSPQSEETIAVAMSNKFMFTLHLFQGLGCNLDPHGGNNRISQGFINCFDFGGMYLDAIPENEIEQFAEVYFRSLFNLPISNTTGENFMTELQRAQQNGFVSSPYTNAALQSGIAMTDYERVLAPDLNMMAIASAAASPTTHPSIIRVLEQTLGGDQIGSGEIIDQRRAFERYYKNPVVFLS